jgi:Tfp pilus assembly protein FimT
VLIIMVIMMAVAAPSFVQIQREANLRASTRAVLARLNYARSTAVSRAVQTRVYFDVEAKTIWVVVQQTDDTGRSDFAPERTSLGRMYQLPPVVQIGAETENVPQRGQIYITFYPDGHAEALQVGLKDDLGRQKTIEVEPVTGRVAVVEPTKNR